MLHFVEKVQTKMVLMLMFQYDMLLAELHQPVHPFSSEMCSMIWVRVFGEAGRRCSDWALRRL